MPTKKEFLIKKLFRVLGSDVSQPPYGRTSGIPPTTKTTHWDTRLRAEAKWLGIYIPTANPRTNRGTEHECVQSRTIAFRLLCMGHYGSRMYFQLPLAAFADHVSQISKLVGSSSASPTRKQTNTPQQRLIRFKKLHDQLQVPDPDHQHLAA